MSIDLSDTQIQVAIISGLFTVVSALIAAAAAAIIGKSIASRQRYKEDFEIAIKDIHFLLQVEDFHCEHNRQSLGQSRKILVRDKVREYGLRFSGKFTPGRVRMEEQ